MQKAFSLRIEVNCFMYNSITDVFLWLLNKQPFKPRNDSYSSKRKTVNKLRRQFELQWLSPAKPHKVNIVCECPVAFMQR